MKHAILFGLNYDHTPDARLRGCINDVRNMEKVLKENMRFDDIRSFTDDTPNGRFRTSGRGILMEINNLARRSWSENLDTAWIHFSGHGCSVRDIGVRDEIDGKDECLVPSDFKRAGVVPDDFIKDCLRNFNPNTRVVFIADCCHSGTIGDLKYRYLGKGRKVVENRSKACPAKILLMSGCMDRQTSADAFNVNQMRKFSGAMTSCLIQSMQAIGYNPAVFTLIDTLRTNLRKKRFTQVPQLTSSFELADDEHLM
jgi:hypothetical protein